MSTVLITGAAGFLGGHLINCLGNEYQVIGVDLETIQTAVRGKYIKASSVEDLADIALAQKPDFIVHAAFKNRKPNECTTQDYLKELLAANIPLFEVAGQLGARMLLVSSSAIYGSARGKKIIDETFPRDPVSLYGVAKVIQEVIAEYHVNATGLQLCILRPFNICGPGQHLGMLLPDWVSRVVSIARGGEPILRVDNMVTSRDFIDVRDVAYAIRLILEDFRENEVVNIASGQSITLIEICDILAALCPHPFEVFETNPSLTVTNVVSQRGSFKRAQAIWGWAPRIGLRESIADIWREWAIKPE